MFKIGDKVRVISNEGDEAFYSVGDTGTVQALKGDENCHYYEVKFDYQKVNNGNDIWYVDPEQITKEGA